MLNNTLRPLNELHLIKSIEKIERTDRTEIFRFKPNMTTSICKNLESFAKTFLNMIPDVTFPPIRYTSKKDTEGHSRSKKLNNCVCLLAMLITLEKCQNSNTIKFFMITSTKHSRKHQIIEDFNKSRSFKVLPTTLIGRLNGV